VRLAYLEDGAKSLTSTCTDANGRVSDLLDGRRLLAGSCRPTFDTGAYGNPFYPNVTITYQVSDPDRNHHMPLLLSDYGYTTYRGS
jgi:5-hydroxyisourate hydrolase